MAATSTAIPAADLAARALDAPLIVAKNICQIAYDTTAATFVTNQTGTLAAGDTSAVGFDRANLVSRHRHKTWKGASSTTHYIAIDLGSIVHDCDTLVIEDHNFSGATITVEADDSVTPSAGVGAWGTQVLNFVATSAMVFSLHATTMYRARYWRIKIVAGGAFVPQASQVWIGKALQIPARALMDSDLPNTRGSDYIELETKGGISHRYKLHGGLIMRAVSFLVPQVYNSTFFTDLSTLYSDANNLDGGIRSFWWCDEPTTTPTGAIYVRLTDTKHKPRSRGAATTFSLEFKEAGG